MKRIRRIYGTRFMELHEVNRFRVFVVIGNYLFIIWGLKG